MIAFPPAVPADRPIAWLFRSCSGRWIFNVDDDEIPSPGLVAALPGLVRRNDITHVWVARRWLHPTTETFIASAPWGTEFQLRLALADERFLQFSDVFHRPIVCSGPSAYVEAPLWHLDTVLNPAAQRRRKAAVYESERPSMRVGGLAHNFGFYVPELHHDLELLPVPAEDADAIDAARAFEPAPTAMPVPPLIHVAADEVDQHWVGPPYSGSLYRAKLTVAAAPTVMTAGVQNTIDVRVTNESDIVWHWGHESRPKIRLAYRWRRAGDAVREPAALRTSLPADLPPGATQLVPVHVVAPATAGAYELEIDLVHEGARWFGVGQSTNVEVQRLRRVTLIARAERLTSAVAEAGVAPEVEPVVLLRDPDDAGSFQDYNSLPGPRRYLLAGTAERGRLGTGAALVARTLSLARGIRRPHWSRPEYRSLLAHLRTSDGLFVDGPNWEPDAAFGREWAWVAATALLWRLDRRPVVIRDSALPGGTGARIAAVRTVLRLLRTSA